MKISLSLLLVSILQAGYTSQKDICRALAMSGGANKGAYEAGVVYGLAHNMDSSDVAWDVITGVSAGAINTAGMAAFEIGKEKEMSEFMIKVLENLKTENVYKDWAGGYLE